MHVMRGVWDAWPRWLPGAVAACLLLAAGCRTNPVTGSRELVLVSERQELSLGDSYHPNIIFMYDAEYQDAELKRYLGTIVMRLHGASHRAQMRADFTVLNTSVHNAFAIPGHVYATRGFLAALQNEAQFAAVMGHELGHVAAGHTAKILTHRVLSTVALGVTGSALGDSVGARGAMAAGQLSVSLLGLSYSREQERQADRLGTYYMTLCGWDPREAVSMQRLLASLGSDKRAVLDKYLSTHPPSAERIANVNAIIEEMSLLNRGWVQGDGVYEERWKRRLAALRAVQEACEVYDRGGEHLRAKEYEEALAAAEESLAMQPRQAPFHRLKGDALRALGRMEEARAAYEESLGLDPRYIPANLGLAQVAFQGKDYEEAERQFAVAAAGWPANALAHYGLGTARYRQEKYAQAIAPLELVAKAAPDDPMVHYVLAVCYDKTDQSAKAYAAYKRAVELGLSGEKRTQAEGRIRVLQPAAPSP